MKKFLTVFTIMVTMMFFFAGCAKCISTETEKVQVTIIECYYEPESIGMLPIGKNLMLIPQPEKYKTVVEYNGVQYSFTDARAYNNYKNKIGQTTTGVLEIRTFDNGIVKYDIIVLD